jgi:hypothetical protein
MYGLRRFTLVSAIFSLEGISVTRTKGSVTFFLENQKALHKKGHKAQGRVYLVYHHLEFISTYQINLNPATSP